MQRHIKVSKKTTREACSVLISLKCDLARPTCVRCFISKKECPGYPFDGFRWVDVSHDTLQSTSKQESSKARSSVTALSGQGALRNSLPSRERNKEACTGLDPSFGPQIMPSAVYEAPLLASLIESFQRGWKSTRLFHSRRRWLEDLAQYQHSSGTLRTAIRAISLSHLARGGGDAARMCAVRSRQEYSKALHLLNATLHIPERAYSLDVLVTVVLM